MIFDCLYFLWILLLILKKLLAVSIHCLNLTNKTLEVSPSFPFLFFSLHVENSFLSPSILSVGCYHSDHIIFYLLDYHIFCIFWLGSFCLLQILCQNNWNGSELSHFSLCCHIIQEWYTFESLLKTQNFLCHLNTERHVCELKRHEGNFCCITTL